LQLLSPERASAAVLARLSSAELDDSGAAALLSSAAQIASPAAGWGLLKLAGDAARSAELRRAAFERVVANAAPRGSWAQRGSDPRFAESLARLLDDDALRESALAAIGDLRLRRLGPQVLALARRDDLPPAERARAIALAAQLKPQGAVPALRALLDDDEPEVAGAALVGLVDLADIGSLRELLARESIPADTRRAAAERAAESTAGAILLLRLIDAGHCAPEVKDAVIAKAVRHPDANVRVLYEKFIPESERPKKLGQSISADEILALAGDANRGRIIFYKSSAAQCKQCHAVQGFGGTTGPELSRIGKKYERRALLETILEPSKAIAPEYIPYLLETTGGQVYAGFLVERNDAGVELRDVENRTIRVPAAEVEALLPQPKSLMPELVLSEVTAQDAADLLAFLASLK
jgi:putative heme-binding domain-containing protein